MKLAKWEDRGYHAMKSSTEKAQRKLHKMQRQAKDVLKQPVAAVLAAAAKTMGLSDLAAPNQLPGAAQKKGRRKAPPAIELLVSTALVSLEGHSGPLKSGMVELHCVWHLFTVNMQRSPACENCQAY